MRLIDPFDIAGLPFGAHIKEVDKEVHGVFKGIIGATKAVSFGKLPRYGVAPQSADAIAPDSVIFELFLVDSQGLDPVVES